MNLKGKNPLPFIEKMIRFTAVSIIFTKYMPTDAQISTRGFYKVKTLYSVKSAINLNPVLNSITEIIAPAIARLKIIPDISSEN